MKIEQQNQILGCMNDVLNQNGLEYTSENIDSLLFRRHENKKLLLAGKYPKGTPKRTKEQDITYRNALERILQSA